jgi:ATP-dependent Zn protease
MYVGRGAGRVKMLNRPQIGPCIIFVDELDT